MNNTKLHILLVEDDQNFGDVLKSYLEMHNFRITLAVNGEAGLKAFNKGDYDLVVMDVMMPKMDGFELATKIRAKDQKTPIIFLTAKVMKEDVLKGFKIGADDYLTKPFNSEELLLRINAILRRIKPPEEESTQTDFTFSNFTFDSRLRSLVYENGSKKSTFKLSPKESMLLRLFALNINDVLERSVALKQIWQEDNYFTARSMDVFVTKLRKYLSLDDNLEIVNIHGNGFQLLDKSSISKKVKP